MSTREEILFKYTSVNDKDIPVISFKRLPSDFHRTKHSHTRGQFIFAETEFLKVFAGNTYYYTTPSQAIWIPPHVEHEVISAQKSTCIMVHIDYSECHKFSKMPAVVSTSPLVNELVKRTAKFGMSYQINTPEFRLVKVLIDELSTLPETNYYLPIPTDKRLEQLSNYLMENTSGKNTIDILKNIACMSKRNLERLFEKDTGMTIGGWIRRQKMLLAIEKLSSGESVYAVASGIGYRSISSFIEAFKETIGKTPGAFFNSKTQKSS